jgi:mono/diheme cytochrome c family protein
MDDDAVQQATATAQTECTTKLGTASTECTAMVTAAETECTTKLDTANASYAELSNACAPWTAQPDTKLVGEPESKMYTLAELTKKCDDLGGYTTQHGACGSVNACQGFSYGSWGELQEHTCAGANSCTGLSCVVPVPKTARTGAEVWEAEYAEPGPGTCAGCHGGYYDGPDWVSDATYFNLQVPEGSTRNIDNWLDTRTAAEQERMVAFGTHYVNTDGQAWMTMAPYHRVLSKVEIHNVVEYLRTLKPSLHVMKNLD